MREKEQKNKKALKTKAFLRLYLFYSPFLVEATGLEPTTFWSLTKRATKLRYASVNLRYSSQTA